MIKLYHIVLRKLHQVVCFTVNLPLSHHHQVIIGTHTIMADGALRAPNGAHQLTLAAEHFSVPVIVCAALYKLSPTHLCSYDQDAFNKIIGPENMLNFSNTKLHSKVSYFILQ